MPANTAKGYPYPVGTDRVTDGDNAIRSLAETVDTQAGNHVSGIVTTPVPSALNTPVNVAITFPVGRFSAPPAVVATSVGTVTRGGVLSTPTTTGVTVWGEKISGGLIAFQICYHAHL